LSNAQEAIAGTNPFDGSSAFAVTKLTVSGTNATVYWVGLLGKRYQVQSNTNFVAGGWVNEGGLLAGTGAEMSAVLPIGTGPKWFRVAVQDIDSDGDGVTDWEELQVGYNPMTNATF